MKKFLALAAVLALSSVHAEELKFGDLNYFLKSGQFNAGADFIINNETSELDSSSTQYEVDNYFLNTHFGYALSDSLNLTAAVEVLIDGETETNDEASADAQGVQNPKLGANFRLLQQDASGINLDFGAVAQINYSQKKTASTSKDGDMLDSSLSSYAEPRTGFEFNARAGKKWNEANEFYLISGAVYHLDGDYKEEGVTKVKVDSSVDLKLGAFYQYRPVNEFMMTLGADAVMVGDKNYKTLGVKEKSDSHLDVRFVFAAKYLVTDSTIFKFQFTKDRNEDFDLGDDEINKRNAVAYGIGLDFLF